MSLYVFMLICGSLSMTRSLPFGLMMGVSRRVYYAGHQPCSVLTLGVVYGLGLTLLQLVERATNGWGVSGCTTSGSRGSWTAPGMRRG